MECEAADLRGACRSFRSFATANRDGAVGVLLGRLHDGQLTGEAFRTGVLVGEEAALFVLSYCDAVDPADTRDVIRTLQDMYTTRERTFWRIPYWLANAAEREQ